MRIERAGCVALGFSILVCGAFFLRERGPNGLPWLPDCTFYQLTGLHCAGCGMTRAAHATLHGRIGEAFRFNPIGMILLPLAFVGIGIEILGWIRGRPLPFRLNLGVFGAWAIVWIMLVFWIVRNIPYWPFSLLAP